ncbi:MAG: hypothetical protein WC876_08325 [Candidatus Thermoplasmatota archaeon]|jgi:sugar O-acyltransferase (sialic acid O-acetyltransferase NeuD family)
MPLSQGPDEPFFIVGAGATARDALAILHERGQMELLRGFLIQGEPKAGQSLAGRPILGASALAALPTGTLLADCIASPMREPFIQGLEQLGHKFISLVHPRANVHPHAKIGRGCVIQGGAAVGADVTIEDHVTLNWNCLVGHDAVVERYAHLTGGAMTGARTRIGHGAMLGLGAVVLEDRRVGARSMLGAMALVNRDIPPGVLAYGQPAVIKRQITAAELADLVAHRQNSNLDALQGKNRP